MTPSNLISGYVAEGYSASIFTDIIRRGTKIESDPEEGGSMFLRNVGIQLPGYTVSQPRRAGSDY
jgi:hypothetical protein